MKTAKRCVAAMVLLSIVFGLPIDSYAQDGLAGNIRSLHTVLEQLYEDMMPLCRGMIGVGRGIAGFAAMWYIASRVWGHIARAEPVDFYPLMRPFVLGFAVLIFPSVIGIINGIMQPTVTATDSMVKNSDQAVARLLKLKEEAIKKTAYWQMYVGPDGSGDRSKWYKYHYGDESEGLINGIGHDIRFAMDKFSYNFRNSIKQWMSEVLTLFFEAAALCINTIRTFYLIVLAVLGPLVFGIAVFDGFQHTLTVWIARYINIFLWLPVANLFGSIIGKIQENMLELDLSQIAANGDTFFSSTDSGYLIFLIIGITGYFTVPGVANYIVHAGGGNALLHKVSYLLAAGGKNLATGAASMSRDVLGDGYHRLSSSISNYNAAAGYFDSKKQDTPTGEFIKEKISGK